MLFYFLIIWFTVGVITGIIGLVSICKDDKQVTFVSILMCLILFCGGLISGIFGMMFLIDEDFCFYKFEK